MEIRDHVIDPLSLEIFAEAEALLDSGSSSSENESDHAAASSRGRKRIRGTGIDDAVFDAVCQATNKDELLRHFSTFRLTDSWDIEVAVADWSVTLGRISCLGGTTLKCLCRCHKTDPAHPKPCQVFFSAEEGYWLAEAACLKWCILGHGRSRSQHDLIGMELKRRHLEALRSR